MIDSKLSIFINSTNINLDEYIGLIEKVVDSDLANIPVVEFSESPKPDNASVDRVIERFPAICRNEGGVLAPVIRIDLRDQYPYFNGNPCDFEKIVGRSVACSLFSPWGGGEELEYNYSRLMRVLDSVEAKVLIISGIEDASLSDNGWSNIEEILTSVSKLNLRPILVTSFEYGRYLRITKSYKSSPSECDFYTCNHCESITEFSNFVRNQIKNMASSSVDLRGSRVGKEFIEALASYSSESKPRAKIILDNIVSMLEVKAWHMDKNKGDELDRETLEPIDLCVDILDEYLSI